MLITAWNLVSQLNTTIEIWIQNKFEETTLDSDFPLLTHFKRIGETEEGSGTTFKGY